jgi:YggT family protein
MILEILGFLLKIASTLLGAMLLARAWMFTVRLHPFNPASKAVAQFTDWLVLPLQKLIPKSKHIEWSCLLAALLVALSFLVLMWMLGTGSLMPPNMIGFVFATALVTMARWALNLVIWLTLIQAILSWVNPLAPIMPVLRTLSDPLLMPIRRILPQFGGFDLSSVALLVLAQIGEMVLNRISYTLLGV